MGGGSVDKETARGLDEAKNDEDGRQADPGTGGRGGTGVDVVASDTVSAGWTVDRSHRARGRGRGRRG